MKKTILLTRHPSPLLIVCGLLMVLCSDYASAAGLRDFTSDGCSLFLDGTLRNRTKWCDCCLQHDIAYWRGGTENDRKKADEALRDCVYERTKDKVLAETMYRGVRAGGHPAFPTWYRWAYGWDYGRGYQPLTGDEQKQTLEKLDRYWKDHPDGYCREKHSLQRPATWAKPIRSEHLKNFYQLDDKVYRSAQPDRKGFQELERLGIRNVLSFRDFHSDDDADSTKLKLFRIRMEAGEIRDEQVIEALRIIRNAEGPILIHCWHGSDRTGLVSAMYRIVFQNWPKEDAIEELMKGGYGYHSMYKNIPEYIRKVDVEKVRLAVMADEDPLLVGVRKYREHVDRIERSAKKVSIQELVQEGAAIADRLRPVIEDLSEADYEVVVKNMKGFIINRIEVIIIEPEAAYFAALAKKHGTENDNLYYQFFRKVRPEGVWPVYIMPQTDLGGCTRYGEGYLAELYTKGKALLPKMTGYYAKKTTEILEDLSNQLTIWTCACGDQQSVIRELRLFLELNKSSEITEKVKGRLEDIEKGRSNMRYQCVGGR